MHRKSKKFLINLKKKMKFEKFERDILKFAIESLDIYFHANEQLKENGYIVVTKNGYQTKSPFVEISKSAWNSFLQGIKTLKIQEMYLESISNKKNQTPGPKLKN